MNSLTVTDGTGSVPPGELRMRELQQDKVEGERSGGEGGIKGTEREVQSTQRYQLHSQKMSALMHLPPTMRALRYNDATRVLSLEEIPTPKELGDWDVLVKVAYVGVCGTDLHITEGHFPCRHGGLTLGHEISGVVEAVGSNVPHVKKGTHVAVNPHGGCGVCDQCDRGHPNYCTGLGEGSSLGFHVDGGFADFVVAPAGKVRKMPDNIGLETAGAIETLSCIYRGRENIGPLCQDARILILGGGVVGLIWASYFHHEGIRKIIMSEPRPERQKTARNMGIGIEVVSPNELEELLGNKDPCIDVVVDCCGIAAAVQGSMKYMARGSTLMCFACAPPTQKLTITMLDIYMKELKIIGSLHNPLNFSKVIALTANMAEKYLNCEKLGIKIYQLEDFKQCFDDLKKGVITKGVFEINPNPVTHDAEMTEVQKPES
ncbi:unnamed protein product [Cyprideis torosa]|uniref:Uncharacterized protein n=1 Tax=Cyprideis torosa TaxID=163714 RepID=A0A7R8W361_9CRUS|nr:unnamed protein product [Cyprideis torosa]CAG0882584.1 unnamed protein product [Cyprideis torosa]